MRDECSLEHAFALGAIITQAPFNFASTLIFYGRFLNCLSKALHSSVNFSEDRRPTETAYLKGSQLDKLHQF